MNREFLKTAWVRTTSVHAAALMAPALPGIYVLGEVEHAAGLPISTDWVYIGRSRNLRQRLRQHDPARETHFDLAEWMGRNSSISEVWYAVLSLEIAQQLEAHLIQELQPRFNRIKYRRKKDEHLYARP